ncbi:lysozyme inhibitor LprI family protein [Ignatzschineria sp. LJL83]
MSVISLSFANDSSNTHASHTLSCDTDFSITTQTLCEQTILDTFEDQLKILQQVLLTTLTENEAYYQNKYQDAFYDNFEMPYQEVKEALIKSHIFWEQYISSECAVVHALSARGTARNILELQCLQNYSEARITLLQEYLKEIQLDAESLLQMP